MIAVLDTPEIRRRVLPVSVAAWHRMGESGLIEKRAELIRGVIVEKMSKSPLHTWISDALFRALLTAAAPDQWVRTEQPLTLADSEPEPDVSVVAGNRAQFADRHPSTALLVAEVCVTSEAADREMIGVYAEANVAEFWLILGRRREIECYSRPLNGAYTVMETVRAGEILTSSVVPGFSLNAALLFPPV